MRVDRNSRRPDLEQGQWNCTELEMRSQKIGKGESARPDASPMSFANHYSITSSQLREHERVIAGPRLRYRRHEFAAMTRCHRVTGTGSNQP